MLGTTLRGEQVVQVCEPCEKHLLAPDGMMVPLHREPLPRDGVVGLSQQGARRRHLQICKDDIPACLLVLKPVPHTCVVGRSSHGGNAVRKAASPLPERKHPQALALSCPQPHGVQLRVWPGGQATR
jgi:hypothetical protein